MFRHLFTLCAMLIASGDLLAEPADSRLFESHSLLELTMPVDFDTLCRVLRPGDVILRVENQAVNIASCR